MSSDASPGGGDEPVRWLDPQEQRAWRAYIRGSRLLHETLDRQLAPYGLSGSSQMRV